MPFKDGHKKYGGRKAGTPNKDKSDKQDMIDLLRELRIAIRTRNVQHVVNKARPDTLVNAIVKLAPKDINIGGQKDNPIIMTPEEKAIAEDDADEEAESGSEPAE